jgi:hypothetical protein
VVRNGLNGPVVNLTGDHAEVSPEIHGQFRNALQITWHVEELDSAAIWQKTGSGFPNCEADFAPPFSMLRVPCTIPATTRQMRHNLFGLSHLQQATLNLTDLGQR